MNYIISVVNPASLERLCAVYDAVGVPLSVILHGRGTAVQSMLELLGIASDEKRIVLALAPQAKTKELFIRAKEELFIGVPGHGVLVAVPVKSIGGGNTVRYLNGGQMPQKQPPQINAFYELIIAVANEGRADDVMNAARRAGATGGTVLHGMGTAPAETAHFLNISIASEKEVILVVAKKEQKNAIMQTILESAGPQTPAGCIVFSLPVSAVAGFGLFPEGKPEAQESTL